MIRSVPMTTAVYSDQNPFKYDPPLLNSEKLRLLGRESSAISHKKSFADRFLLRLRLWQAFIIAVSINFNLTIESRVVNIGSFAISFNLELPPFNGEFCMMSSWWTFHSIPLNNSARSLHP